MEARYNELTDRLVAVGRPSFSASEFHELHDYIIELRKKVEGTKKIKGGKNYINEQ